MRIRGKEGVTLIEVMVVVAIVGMLAAIAIPAYNNYVTRSRRSDAFTALETVRAAQEMYRAEKGFYASSFTGNVLAGCSTNMAGDNYTISVNRPTTTTFTVTATPQNKQASANDFYFQIDQNGTQAYSSDGSSWNTDKEWEDLH
jgi:type IV pilus assembly protein PilE